ncbi:MAG TPA: hypothetical protein VFD06_02730 [Candidatus Polarisedimenticolia bacterium]|nr:hypothetical protein [Candidatus Polarisedimenticolia bacterium]
MGEQKDLWDKFGVLLQPVGGALAALAVAVVGIRGSQVINERQAADTNARLYSELMSRREEAESSLRKDMFVSIIDSFLRPQPGDLGSMVLNLELLAYNFHESLNLKPLFLDLQRRLRETSQANREEYRQRIDRVAREITARQLFSLEGHGDSFRRSVDLEDLERTGRFGQELDAEEVQVDGTRVVVRVRALELDRANQQLIIRLEVSPAEGGPELTESRATFQVGFYDFPLIDNTRLANGMRCAVTLSAWSKSNADLTTTCFPGEYASLKDRPYIDEVMKKLTKQAAPQP